MEGRYADRSATILDRIGSVAGPGAKNAVAGALTCDSALNGIILKDMERIALKYGASAVAEAAGLVSVYKRFGDSVTQVLGMLEVALSEDCEECMEHHDCMELISERMRDGYVLETAESYSGSAALHGVVNGISNAALVYHDKEDDSEDMFFGYIRLIRTDHGRELMELLSGINPNQLFGAYSVIANHAMAIEDMGIVDRVLMPMLKYRSIPELITVILDGIERYCGALYLKRGGDELAREDFTLVVGEAPVKFVEEFCSDIVADTVMAYSDHPRLARFMLSLMGRYMNIDEDAAEEAGHLLQRDFMKRILEPFDDGSLLKGNDTIITDMLGEFMDKMLYHGNDLVYAASRESLLATLSSYVDLKPVQQVLTTEYLRGAAGGNFSNTQLAEIFRLMRNVHVHDLLSNNDYQMGSSSYRSYVAPYTVYLAQSVSLGQLSEGQFEHRIKYLCMLPQPQLAEAIDPYIQYVERLRIIDRSPPPSMN